MSELIQFGRELAGLMEVIQRMKQRRELRSEKRGVECEEQKSVEIEMLTQTRV